MGSFAVIAKGMLRQEQRSGRVMMGYLLGCAIVGYWMSNFLRYAVDAGEPINILETFCVVEQHYVNMLFLVLGWSSPVYSLALDITNNIGAKYNITFPWLGMMKAMSVPQAFAVTFLFLYLYLAFMGVLLYVAALLLSGTAGMVVVMGVHLAGYLRMIDGTLSYWQSAALFLEWIAVLMVLSSVFVKKIEFQQRDEVEG